MELKRADFIIDKTWRGCHAVSRMNIDPYSESFKIEKKFGTNYLYSMVKCISVPKEKMLTESTTKEQQDHYGRVVELLLEIVSNMEMFQKHPNILHIEEYNVENLPQRAGYILLLKTELASNLADLLANNGVSYWDVIQVGCDICDALMICQEKNIVHGAVNTYSIFRGADGHYKLGNIGLESCLSQYDIFDIKLCQENDLQALGKVLYQIANGGKLSNASQALSEKLPSHVDQKLGKILMRACKENGYSSPLELKNALLDYSQGKGEKTSKKSSGKKRTLLISVIALAMVGAVAASVGKILVDNSQFTNGDVIHQEEETMDNTSLSGEDSLDVYEEALLYYWGGKGINVNPRKAVELLQLAVDQGDARAMELLSKAYMRGQGVEPDAEKGQELLKKAITIYQEEAAQGSGDAMDSLAECYQAGFGVKQDHKKADKWHKKAFQAWKKAAKKGNLKDQYSLAYAYQYGVGTGKDLKTAVKLYKACAEQGETRAFSSLGSLFYFNHKPGEAMPWYEKAFAAGNMDAGHILIELYKENGFYDKLMALCKEAEELNNANLLSSVYYVYHYGDLKNPEKAAQIQQIRLALLEESAANLDLGSMMNLGVLYSQGGEGVKRDLEQAKDWYGKARNLYEKARSQGDCNCLYSLARIYGDKKSGFYDKKSLEKIYQYGMEKGIDSVIGDAVSYYLQENASEETLLSMIEKIQNEEEQGWAYSDLASHFHYGDNADERKSFFYYKKALEFQEDNYFLHTMMGDFYAQGTAVKKDLTKAEKHYKEAVSNGGGVEDAMEFYITKCNDEKKAVALAQKAFEAGDYKVYQQLGKILYVQGKDPVKYYTLAVDAGNISAMVDLAEFYEKSTGQYHDGAKAVEWYEKAIENGSTKAKVKLSQYYLEQEEDVDNALRLAKELMEHEDAEALYLIAQSYLEGSHGLKVNTDKAIEYLKEGSTVNDIECMLKLGYLYENGQGLPKDEDKARELYQRCYNYGYDYIEDQLR